MTESMAKKKEEAIKIHELWRSGKIGGSPEFDGKSLGELLFAIANRAFWDIDKLLVHINALEASVSNRENQIATLTEALKKIKHISSNDDDCFADETHTDLKKILLEIQPIADKALQATKEDGDD